MLVSEAEVLAEHSGATPGGATLFLRQDARLDIHECVEGLTHQGNGAVFRVIPATDWLFAACQQTSAIGPRMSVSLNYFTCDDRFDHTRASDVESVQMLSCLITEMAQGWQNTATMVPVPACPGFGA
jgi:hypothetical protein